MHLSYLFFFFFKQKTAYEMRISDWSSDVCSSDLRIWQKKPEISKTVKQGVRIPPAPPVRYKVWHAPNRRAYAVGGEHPQQVALAAHDPDLALVHFDPLRERAKIDRKSTRLNSSH